jgi:hypothetical protein
MKAARSAFLCAMKFSSGVCGKKATSAARSRIVKNALLPLWAGTA